MNTILGLGLLVFVVVASWIQIPKEDPEIIEARKRYGSVK